MNKENDLTQQRFGSLAKNYVGSTFHSGGHTLDVLVAQVLAHLPPEDAPALVLDIATGGGHVALALAKEGGQRLHIIASDLTPNMLGAAQAFITGQGQSADFCQIEAGSLPFADASLSAITCRYAAHHFPNVNAFVRECGRVLKPGGLLGLVDQIGPNEPAAARYCNAYEKLRDPSHVWQYATSEWESFFNAAGLQTLHTEQVDHVFDFDWWTRMQANNPTTKTQLTVMLKQAPAAALAWLEPHFAEDRVATFTHRHTILIMRRIS
jgi:ubiquinone/menaquinone biosynthesis C-methylase UbiE